MALQRKSKVIFKFNGVTNQAMRFGRSDDFRFDGEAEKGRYLVVDNDEFSIVGSSGGYGDISFAMEPFSDNDLYFVVNNPTFGQQTVRAYKGRDKDNYDRRELDYGVTSEFEANGWKYSFYRYSKDEYDKDNYATLTLTISKV